MNTSNSLSHPKEPDLLGTTSLSMENTQRIISHINKLTKDLVRYKQELNAIQSSTGKLPLDVLSIIFENACPQINVIPFSPDEDSDTSTSNLDEDSNTESSENSLFVMKLASVSSHWRGVVLSTPKLWTNLSLTLTSEFPDVQERKLTILSLYMENSSPLSLWLHIRRDPNDVNHRSMGEMMKYLLSNAPRIGALWLNVPPSPWVASLAHQKSNFVNLKHLRLDWSETGEDSHPDKVLRLEMLKSLRSLTLSYFYTPKVKLPSSSRLSTLNLFNGPIDVGIQLLVSSPNLVEYRCWEPTNYADWAANTWVDLEEITLPHLELMEWTFRRHWRNSFDDRLFALLHLPRIASLTLHKMDLPDTFAEFTRRISSSLRTLKLVDSSLEVEPCRQLFESLVQLQKLSIQISKEGGFHAVFEALIPEEKPSKEVNMLPLLEELDLDFRGYQDPGLLRDIPDVLAKFMKQREVEASNTKEFRFNVTMDWPYKPDWKGMRQRKEEFGETSFRVYHNSRLVFPNN